jgi:hypothetical protein
MCVHAPEPVVAVVVVLAAGTSGRLAVGSGLDVAAHGEDQALGGSRDLGNRRVEGGDIAGGRHSEPADLAHVLAGRGLDLTGCRCVVLIAKCSNASAHAGSVPHTREGAGRSSRPVPSSNAPRSKSSCNVAVIPRPPRPAMMGIARGG